MKSISSSDSDSSSDSSSDSDDSSSSESESSDSEVEQMKIDSDYQNTMDQYKEQWEEHKQHHAKVKATFQSVCLLGIDVFSVFPESFQSRFL